MCVELPEIEPLGVLIRIILGHTDVEHLEKPLLPLLHQRRRAKNEEAMDQSEVEQTPENQARLDGLAQSHIIGHHPADRPLLGDLPADPKLVRIQIDAAG